MKRFILACGLVLTLSACAPNTQNLVVREYKVVEIPQEYIKSCPKMVDLPRYSTLTNAKAAKLIVTLADAYNACKLSVEGIEKYMTEAKKIIEEGKVPK